MSRWLLIPICSLALVVSSYAQEDDLDALLAGLGDEPAATESAVVPPPAEAPAAEVPASDPFADLINSEEAATAAEPAFEETVETITEVPVADATAEDPFADLLDSGWDAEMAPADAVAVEEVPAVEESVVEPVEAMPEDNGAEVAVETVAEEIPAAEDSVDDLLGDEWTEEPAVVEEVVEDVVVEEVQAVEGNGDEELVTQEEVVELVIEKKEKPAKKSEKSVEEPKKEKAEKPVQAVKKSENRKGVEKEPEASSKPQPKAELKPKVSDKVSDWNTPVVW